jgi:hypothetical protein
MMWPLYWKRYEADPASDGYAGSPCVARALLSPWIGYGMAFVKVPWQKRPFIRFFNWDGYFEIPGPPE